MRILISANILNGESFCAIAGIPKKFHELKANLTPFCAICAIAGIPKKFHELKANLTPLLRVVRMVLQVSNHQQPVGIYEMRR